MTERFTVARETCSRCKAEPRVKGQRWGRKCFAEAQRKHRVKRYREASKFREILAHISDGAA